MKLRTLKQKTSAAWLSAALVCIPAIPVTTAQLAPQPAWERTSDGDLATITSDSGATISFVPPRHWEAQQTASTVTLRSGHRRIVVEIMDRGGGDPKVEAERMLRLDRIGGIASGFDGGNVSVPASDLSGPTCVLVATEYTGHCAVLLDDAVIVRITSIGTAERPAAPIDSIIASVSENSAS